MSIFRRAVIASQMAEKKLSGVFAGDPLPETISNTNGLSTDFLDYGLLVGSKLYAYDNNLIRTEIATIENPHRNSWAGCSNEKYAFLGFGILGSDTDANRKVEVYDKSLLKVATITGLTVKGGYAMQSAGNGVVLYGGSSKKVNMIDSNLMLSTLSDLPISEAGLTYAASVKLNGNAIFSGGSALTTNIPLSHMFRYDENFVRHTMTSMGVPRMYHRGATVGGKCLFGGGVMGNAYLESSYTTLVDIYDSSFLRLGYTNLATTASNEIGASQNESFAFFASGRNLSVQTNAIAIFDKNLVRTDDRSLTYAKQNVHVFKAGKNVIFASGGSWIAGQSNSVDILQYE